MSMESEEERTEGRLGQSRMYQLFERIPSRLPTHRLKPSYGSPTQEHKEICSLAPIDLVRSNLVRTLESMY